MLDLIKVRLYCPPIMAKAKSKTTITEEETERCIH